MRERRSSKLSWIAALLVVWGSQSNAQCDPRTFVVQNTVAYQISAETELSFVLTATKEEFDRAKAGGAMSGTYGLISGSADYAQSRERAQRIAQSIRFDTSSSYALNYFAQTTSDIWANAYIACLGDNSPGLNIWLDKKQGDFLTFNAIWVGNDTALGSATLDAEPVVFGGQLIDVPMTWTKGEVQTVVVRRDGNQDVYLGLDVGGKPGSAVVVRDPPRWEWVNQVVVADRLMSATSSYSNPCTAGEDTSCIYPMHGGLFRTETAVISDLSSSDRSNYSQVFEQLSPHQICVRITQSTGACQFRQTASGRLSALEEVPVASE